MSSYYTSILQSSFSVLYMNFVTKTRQRIKYSDYPCLCSAYDYCFVLILTSNVHILTIMGLLCMFYEPHNLYTKYNFEKTCRNKAGVSEHVQLVTRSILLNSTIMFLQL